MARKRISEYRAKTILHASIQQTYTGLAVDATAPLEDQLQLNDADRYVVKVDQGVKGRFKKGLVRLDRTAEHVKADIKDFAEQGYTFVLVEEYRKHDQSDERYLMIERQREANVIAYSLKGGIDIEQHADEVHRVDFSKDGAQAIDQALGLTEGSLQRLITVFDDNYFSFLEINPLVIGEGKPQMLDAAVEVDGEAEWLVDGAWTAADYRRHSGRDKTPAELDVEALAGQSQASFSLEVLHPDGQVFVLLSGGGASVVVADEINNLGYGKELGNYGEYSGNPSQEETYLYTHSVLSLLLASKAKNKVLIIGGGVANFTDIRATFKGVIQALEAVKGELQKQGVRVFVRRGGPYEEEGLTTMRDFLDQSGLLGGVAGPEMKLSQLVADAVAAAKGGQA